MVCILRHSSAKRVRFALRNYSPFWLIASAAALEACESSAGAGDIAIVTPAIAVGDNALGTGVERTGALFAIVENSAAVVAAGGNANTNYYLLGDIDITNPDTNSNAPDNILSLTGDDARLFFISTDNKLYLTTVPDYEAKSSYAPLTIAATQAQSAVITLRVTDANEPPTAITPTAIVGGATLAGNVFTIAEDALAVTSASVAGGVADTSYYLIGDISVTDPDKNNNFLNNVLSIMGVGDSSFFASRFYISTDNKLYLTTAPDFEATPSYSLVITTGALSLDITLDLADVNEAPTDITLTAADGTGGSGNALTIAENSAAVDVTLNDGTTVQYYLIGDIIVDDPDKDNNFLNNLLSLTGDDEDHFFISTDNKLYLNTAPNFETAVNPDNSYSLTITATAANDNTLAIEKMFTITEATNTEGNANPDTFVSTADNTLFYGLDGDDTYVWAHGGGHDTIYEKPNEGTDKLRLTSISLADVTFARQHTVNNGVYTSTDITLTIAESSQGAGGSITLSYAEIAGSPSAFYDGVEKVHFDTDGDGIVDAGELELNLIYQRRFNDGVAAGVTTVTTTVTPSADPSANLVIGFDIYGIDGTFQRVDNRNFLIADFIYGGDAQDDYIYSFAGKDKLYGLAGNDNLYGGDDNDYIIGGDGNDNLYGDDGDDELEGGNGNDNLYGDDGDDRLEGYDGDDNLYGGAGKDRLNGGYDNDRLYGGAGDDNLYGGDDDDRLEGFDGDDNLYGGAGGDTYVWVRGDGGDTIYEKPNEGTDKLTLSRINIADVSFSRNPVSGDQFTTADVTLTIAESSQGVADGGSVTLSYEQYDSNGDGTIGGTTIGVPDDEYYQGVEKVHFDTDGDGIVNAPLFADDGSLIKAGELVLNLIYQRQFGGSDAAVIDGSAVTTTGIGDAAELIIGFDIAGERDGNGNYMRDFIEAGAGNDYVYGLNGDDILEGQAGDDTLYGGAGDDKFYYNQGDGEDIITENANEGVNDTLVLGGLGSSLADIQIQRWGDNEQDDNGAHWKLIFEDTVIGGVTTSNSVLLKYSANSDDTGVDSIHFDINADGNVDDGEVVMVLANL